MVPPVEHAAAVECRASGSQLIGVGMVYGDTAPGFRERFEPGGLVGMAEPFALVMQHDTSLVIADTAGALVVNDTAKAFEARAELAPDSAALVLVRSGALTGMSVGFVAHREHRDRTGLRVIEKYSYRHLGLVDRPAFPASTVEVRARWNAYERIARYRSFVPTGRRLQCECSGPSCGFAEFAADAFTAALTEATASGANITAVVNNYDNVVASTQKGTLRLDTDGTGALLIDLDVPGNAQGHRLLDADHDAGTVARPFVDDPDGTRSVVVEGDDGDVGTDLDASAAAQHRAYVNRRARRLARPDRDAARRTRTAGRTGPAKDARMAVSLDAVGLAEAAGLPIVADPDPDDDVDGRTSPVGVRLLAVVTERIERYAPSAPSEVQNEAAIRFAAYLNGATSNPNAAGSVSIGDLGPITSSAHTHAGAFRTSGAKGLLSPWRIRRGTVAGA